jgi:hypothetical protein
LISTAREPPTLTVSSANAGAQTNAASNAARPKRLIQKRLSMLFSLNIQFVLSHLFRDADAFASS